MVMFAHLHTNKPTPFEPLEPPAPRMAVGPDAQPTEPGKPPAPPATQAPERVELVWDAECRGWVQVGKGFVGVQFVRADVHEATCALATELGRANTAYAIEKLSAAERRIAELEKNQDAFAEGAFGEGK